MDHPRSEQIGLKQLCQGVALCGIPIGGGMPTNMLAASAPGEILSLALMLGGFVGAGIWMFRKWGRPSTPPPEEVPYSQPQHGLARS